MTGLEKHKIRKKRRQGCRVCLFRLHTVQRYSADRLRGFARIPLNSAHETARPGTRLRLPGGWTFF